MTTRTYIQTVKIQEVPQERKKLETSDTHCSDRDETCKCSGQRTSVQELKEGDSEED